MSEENSSESVLLVAPESVLLAAPEPVLPASLELAKLHCFRGDPAANFVGNALVFVKVKINPKPGTYPTFTFKYEAFNPKKPNVTKTYVPVSRLPFTLTDYVVAFNMSSYSSSFLYLKSRFPALLDDYTVAFFVMMFANITNRLYNLAKDEEAPASKEYSEGDLASKIHSFARMDFELVCDQVMRAMVILCRFLIQTETSKPSPSSKVTKKTSLGIKPRAVKPDTPCSTGEVKKKTGYKGKNPRPVKPKTLPPKSEPALEPASEP